MFPFGKGRARKSRPLVETTPRVAQPPSTGVAREEVRVVIEGAPQTLEIVRQARIYGQEAFWICPKCLSPLGQRQPRPRHPISPLRTKRYKRVEAPQLAAELARAQRCPIARVSARVAFCVRSSSSVANSGVG